MARKSSAIGSVGGFTLLELMVVLAILVMMAALLPLAIDRALPGRRVAVTADRLVSAVRSAQASSFASGRPVTLVLTAEGLTTAGAPEAAKPLVPFPPSVRVSLRDEPGNLATELTVFSDGSAEARRFEIEADAHHRSAVEVSALTGRVTLQREP